MNKTKGGTRKVDPVSITIIICVVVGLVIAIVVGIVAFMAGSLDRKKSAEATIGSAEEEAKKIIPRSCKNSRSKKERKAVLEGKDEIISCVMNPKRNLQNDAKKYSVRNDAFSKEKNFLKKNGEFRAKRRRYC